MMADDLSPGELIERCLLAFTSAAAGLEGEVARALEPESIDAVGHAHLHGRIKESAYDAVRTALDLAHATHAELRERTRSPVR